MATVQQEHMESALSNDAVSTSRSGEIVTWRVRNVFVERQELLKALRKHGLNAHVLEPKKGTYLQRAIHQCTQDDVIRPIGEDADCISYAIVGETADLGLRSWYGEMRESVTLDKKTGALSFRHQSALSDRIRNQLSVGSGKLLSVDVGRVIRRVLEGDASGKPLRDTGGVYFVPFTHFRRIDALEAALSEAVTGAGQQARVLRFKVVMDVRSASDLISVLEESFNNNTERLVSEALSALERDGSKAKLFQSRAAAIGGILEQVQLYESVVGARLENVRKRAKSAKAVIMDCLSKKLGVSE